MGAPVNPAPPAPLYQRGDLVVCPFPFSAATGFKNRPALVLATWLLPGVGYDCLICIVTSQGPTSGADPYSLPLDSADVQGGTLSASRSYLRPAYLFIDEGTIRYRIGTVRGPVVDAAGQIIADLVKP
jgi:mRNA interferase MazF